MYCLWDDCGISDRGVREYHVHDEWEFHVRRTHLLHVQYACSIQGDSKFDVVDNLGCGEMFTTDDALKQHYSDVHNSVTKGMRATLGKRKFVEEDVTPIIEAMPAEIARRSRAVYDGPSRSLSIGQNVAVDKKQRKS